ncbi:MAG: aminotransferase class V-fold PLP-dependent enzyme [Cytophagales bacterium]|nr:aminotransferase class V-fold PLP-dependent enzyme [Cytophagales bacterium]
MNPRTETQFDILDALAREIERVQTGQAVTTTGKAVRAAEVRAHLRRYDFTAPVPLDDLFEDVARMLREWNVQMNHPRYLGLFNPNTTLASVVADALVALYNPQLAAWSHAPAANEMERHVLAFIGKKLGFPEENFAAHFTSGGSEANLTAALLALAKHFPAYLQKGLVNLGTQPTAYVSEYAHNSFDKIVKHVGLGTDALRIIPTNDALQLDAEALRRQLEADLANGCTPFLVVGTAGTTSAGVIDPLPELAGLCRQYGCWFHVDAAWGGAITLSDKWKGLVAGMERADSVTIDAHKWFFVPFGAGMFFCRHRDVVGETFRVRADYMPKPQEDTYDPYHTTLQWTRRFMGLKLFMTLAEQGEEAFGTLLDEQMALGRYFRERLAGNGWQLLNPTELPVFCFTHPALAGGGAHDRVLQRLYAESNLWISAVTLKGGQKAFRACLTNYNTTAADLDFVLAELNRIIRDVAATS